MFAGLQLWRLLSDPFPWPGFFEETGDIGRRRLAFPDSKPVLEFQHGWPNLLFNLVNRNFFVTGLGYKNLLVYLLMLVYLVNPFFCWQLIRAFFSGLHGATMRSPYGPAAGSP